MRACRDSGDAEGVMLLSLVGFASAEDIYGIACGCPSFVTVIPRPVN
jgi:hypothetical protein